VANRRPQNAAADGRPRPTPPTTATSAATASTTIGRPLPSSAARTTTVPDCDWAATMRRLFASDVLVSVLTGLSAQIGLSNPFSDHHF
jgi:hypothetical protein